MQRREFEIDDFIDHRRYLRALNNAKERGFMTEAEEQIIQAYEEKQEEKERSELLRAQRMADAEARRVASLRQRLPPSRGHGFESLKQSEEAEKKHLRQYLTSRDIRNRQDIRGQENAPSNNW
jgi:hypothetical protein